MKKENLMFGPLGNGVSVCDRNRMKSGNYRVIAHITYHRKVKYYVKDLSDDAKIEIEDMAQFGNMAISVCRPDVFALRPISFKPQKDNTKNKILSFFSSEQEAQSLLLFFFSYDGHYYRAFREKDLPDAVLERQMMNFLYPDNKSFHYAGWFCRFNKDDLMFYLYTPSEMEQPAGFRYSEMEVSTPAQAIEFINCY